MTGPLFIAAAFLGSALLFVVQPIVVRMLLPSLGGSPAAWNAAMVFFQTLLLAGYLYSHLSLKWLGIARHRFLHAAVMLLPLLVLPIAMPAGWSPPAESDPTIWTLLILAVMVGAPYFALSTVSPTLQHWFAHSDRPGKAEPYMLYAAGNAGSVIALLSYPFLLEPFMGLRQQAWAWAVTYFGFLALLALCSLKARSSHVGEVTSKEDPASWTQRLRWMAYAAIPSVLLLGVTRHIGDEIASFPLLWIIPLTLYLATFIIAFGNFSGKTLGISSRIARLLVIPVVLTLFRVNVPLLAEVLVHLGLFTALALVLHQRLYDSRPSTQKLTEFYVFLSLGGALGGVFVVLLAPVIFDAIYEYPIAIAVALLALQPDAESPGFIARLRSSRIAVRGVLGLCLVLAAIAGVQVASSDFIHSTADSIRLLAAITGLIAYVLLARPRHYALVISALLLAGVVVHPVGTVLQDRSFFGVLRVQQIEGETTMVHGTTIHGSQRVEIADIAQGYYHPSGPAGATISALQEPGKGMSIGLVGLGVGALAAVGREGDELAFYEIDPGVVKAAADPQFFSYLSDSDATISVVLGDGRLRLSALNPDHDLLVIDAFSGDAIPVHLVTREAFAVYRQVTGDRPILLHVSNRHLNLPPVVAATAQAAGLQAWLWEYDPEPEDLANGAAPSRWTLLMPEGSAPPNEGWEPIRVTGRAWTDDYSNILSALKPE